MDPSTDPGGGPPSPLSKEDVEDHSFGALRGGISFGTVYAEDELDDDDELGQAGGGAGVGGWPGMMRQAAGLGQAA